MNLPRHYLLSVFIILIVIIVNEYPTTSKDLSGACATGSKWNRAKRVNGKPACRYCQCQRGSWVCFMDYKRCPPVSKYSKLFFDEWENGGLISVPGYAGSLSTALPGGGGGAAWERLGAETVLTGLVTATYFAAMERRWTGAAPALLGAAYTAGSLVSMPSLNPARSLGPSFVLSRWEGHWVCWVGGLGGGIACGLLHEWGSRRRGAPSRASSPRDLDELDKPAFPAHHYRHAPTYCPAAAPRPDTSEPLYSGSKSLYCRSPPPTRHTLHRSQSVYSKSSSAATSAAGALMSAQSLLLRPPLPQQHTLTHNQNTHNAQREPSYGTATHANTIRTGPAGAPVQDRRDSLYSTSTRRGPLSSDDSAYGTYTRGPYRAPAQLTHAHPPEHY